MKTFLKRIALGFLLALPWIGAATAQQNNMYCVVNPTTPPYQWVPCNTFAPLSTVNIGPDSQASLSFANGQPLSLIAYDFGSGTLNTSSQFNRPITGGGGNATAATNAVGQTTLGTGTTANGWSVLISQRTIWDRNPGYNYYQGNINIPIPSVTHAYMLFGFVGFPFTAGLPSPTLATPAQNAAAFEFGTNGKLSAVTFASGTRQLVADLSVAQSNTPGSTQATSGVAGTYTGGCGCIPQIQSPKGGTGTLTDSFKYVIVFRGDNILWYIEQPNGNLGLVAYTTRGAVGLDVNQVTSGYLTLADATGPSATATMQINQITVGDTAKNAEPGFDRAVYPQQALTAVNDAVGVSAMGAGSCTFTTVSNTNVTLVFEATDANGSNWTPVTAYPWGGGAGIQTVPSGTNGQWTVPCAGLNQVRMRVSAIGATPTVLGTAEASVAPSVVSIGIPFTTFIQGNATGSTGAVVGTLAGTAGKTTYLCDFDVSAVGGTAAIGPVVVAGLLGGSKTYQLTAPASNPPLSKNFNPCLPASAVNTAITITTTADGTATAVDVNSSGYQQ
jgi:hypothetical protein